MKKNISKWYQSCGIQGLSQQQYEQRVEGIESFCERKIQISEIGELARGFMGAAYDINKVAGFVDAFNERDISFSEENTQEIPLLAGMVLFHYMNGRREGIAMLLLLLSLEGYRPCQEEIYEKIMAVCDNRRMELRKMPDIESVKISATKKISEEQKEDWEAGADYMSARFAEQLRYIKALNDNLNVLNQQMICKKEESNLLWWMVADWSDVYDCRLEEINDKQAALAVPIEVMNCLAMVPGPITVKKIIKKALSGKGLEKRYAVKDYISAADEKLLFHYKPEEWEHLSDVTGFVPILELLQRRARFPKEEDLPMVYKLFGETYDPAFLDKEISVFEFACQLYYECELVIGI